MKFTKIENSRLGETMYIGKHESGLGVFVIPKKGFMRKYGLIGTRYGSVDNTFIPKGETDAITVPDGIAHFLEHKLFEQPDGSNVFEGFIKNGAGANAFTSFNRTCYLFNGTEKLAECLEHLISYVQTPYFTDENVDKEQGIIGQEIRMYDDDPEWRVQFSLLQALYEKNPVNIDIAGTIESISKIDKEVLYKCYNSFYDPSNMCLCVVGDVDCDVVAEIVDKTVVSKGGTKVVSVYPEEKAGAYKKEIRSKMDVSIPLFNLGYKDNTPHLGDDIIKNEIAMKILVKLIAGESSDLYMQMYEEGIINNSFDTSVMCEPQFSCVIFGGESQTPEQVCERIRSKVEEYKKTGFDEESFNNVKKSIIGSFLRKFNDARSLGNMLMRYVLDECNIFNFMDIADTVDMDYITERFLDVFCEENSSLSVVS